MVLPTSPPTQRRGLLGRLSAYRFRFTWATIAAVCIPVLAAVTALALALLND